jgi:NADH dehydrogenase FAD-containing subunit
VAGRLVVLGTGWAAMALLRTIDTARYDVVVISPRNHFVFTPLLAGSAVGTLEHRWYVACCEHAVPLSAVLNWRTRRAA